MRNNFVSLIGGEANFRANEELFFFVSQEKQGM
jgi:hypothetical protein